VAVEHKAILTIRSNVIAWEVQYPPNGESGKPGRSSSEFEGKRNPDKVDETVGENGVVLDIGNLSDWDIEFNGPRDKEDRGCETGRISHQREEDYAEKVNILSPLGPADRVVGIECWYREERLTECCFISFFRTKIDRTWNWVFVSVRNGSENLGLHYYLRVGRGSRWELRSLYFKDFPSWEKRNSGEPQHHPTISPTWGSPS
jgi:hypothetical protein